MLPFARLTLSLIAALPLALGGCRAGAPETATPAAPAPTASAAVREADVRSALTALADDSMQGRATGTLGGLRAAEYLAGQLRAMGVAPAGDSDYFQGVPTMTVAGRDGRPRLALRPDSVPEPASDGRRIPVVNVVGIVRGSDPARRDSAIVVAAHYDHLGIGPAVAGDSIYNGADDDGSGVVAVLEVARAIARGPAPKRTVVFLLSTGEEVGLLGTRHYIEHPVVPLERTVAQFEIEMIGRPDSLAGGAGRAWLTGYDRSTMGDMLRAAGSPIVADPRPDQQFFYRSDNIAFARRGIPAHTLSSYNMHAEYHSPSDEVDEVDFAHMTAVVQAAVDAVRLLADGPAPEWKPGGRPEAAGR